MQAIVDSIILRLHPLPLISAALQQLCNARMFTKLDLRSAYNLTRIRKGDEWKMAFSTTSGHYQYQVIPYELACAPSVFQCLINDVLQDFLGRFVIAHTMSLLRGNTKKIAWNAFT